MGSGELGKRGNKHVPLFAKESHWGAAGRCNEAECARGEERGKGVEKEGEG